jgi:hypothetical protein
MDIFQTATMTLEHSDSTVVAQHLACQLDTVNVQFDIMQDIPYDSYELYSIGWISPVPKRSDYFIDETTGTRYSVFGNVAVYTDHLECQLSKINGTTP